MRECRNLMGVWTGACSVLTNYAALFIPDLSLGVVVSLSKC